MFNEKQQYVFNPAITQEIRKKQTLEILTRAHQTCNRIRASLDSTSDQKYFEKFRDVVYRNADEQIRKFDPDW